MQPPSNLALEVPFFSGKTEETHPETIRNIVFFLLRFDYQRVPQGPTERHEAISQVLFSQVFPESLQVDGPSQPPTALPQPTQPTAGMAPAPWPGNGRDDIWMMMGHQKLPVYKVFPRNT